jgi:predicted TIM-barrel fold metal-dependent hydrolase
MSSAAQTPDHHASPVLPAAPDHVSGSRPCQPFAFGGITDRLLSDYSNVYGDLSAGPGLKALLRDEDHTRAFLARHQDKLMFGSDCSDSEGTGDRCSGSQCIAALKRLAPSRVILRKIFYQNAVRILKIQT